MYCKVKMCNIVKLKCLFMAHVSIQEIPILNYLLMWLKIVALLFHEICSVKNTPVTGEIMEEEGDFLMLFYSCEFDNISVHFRMKAPVAS